MRFYYIIVAILLIQTTAKAQLTSTIAGQAIAALEQSTLAIGETTTYDEAGTSRLTLTTDKKINSVKVVDEAGDVVISRSVQNGESVKLNLHNLKKGLYYIQVYCDGENILRKFLKK